MKPFVLNEDRFFEPDPTVRSICRELYRKVKDLPIISPHGHVDPTSFVTNEPFPNPTELILIPDHYIFRMLYSQGISLERLGIPPVDGSPVETDPRKVWQTFGASFHLFSGTPTGIWLQHEFAEVFGIQKPLNKRTALDIYDEIQEKLLRPEFLPRALFERFHIEVLTTTDAAFESLEPHRKIRKSGWQARIIPCFRPDSVIDLATVRWKQNIEKLEACCGFEITSYGKFIEALERRRRFFKEMGAVSTDQGVLSPYTHRLTDKEADSIFQRALMGRSTEKDSHLFTAHMLMEMARMSWEDGLVMQIHVGAFRNHNRVIFEKFGPDKGADIPVQTEFTRNLSELLNEFGNDSRFTLVVFTLDESTYSRELAPLAGHYPALKLGAPWWFHDSLEGMRRFRQQVTETAGIYNTVGFTDDTRAFPSVPARHDMARRMDCNFLAGLVARHIIGMEEAKTLSVEMAYQLAKRAYRL